jgi:multidrug efflux pump subunit AcrA (membrane-fusion protein)
MCLFCVGPGQATTLDNDPLLESPTVSAAVERKARGVLRARDQAVLSSELAGRIVEMPYTDGQDFSKGEVLVRFDCSAYRAQLNAAQAAVRAAREELNHNKQLAALNSVGRFQVALAEARQAQAQAEAQVYQVQVKRCRSSTTAPWRCICWCLRAGWARSCKANVSSSSRTKPANPCRWKSSAWVRASMKAARPCC